jgi:alpha-D-glucose phosphate-specific phosphoglucomutase
MIKFGTDGWRARIAEDFTFDNLSLVTQAYINYLKKQSQADKGLVVGYDNRYLSEKYAEISANIAAANGLKVFLTENSAPTPAVSFAVREKGAAGAIMITASHNPPEWNGFKIKANYAGSASPEITKAVEDEVLSLSRSRAFRPGGILNQPSNIDNIVLFDPKNGYLKHLASLVDLDLIAKANLKIVVDPMFGAGIGYLKEILGTKGIEVEETNGYRDPTFGGVNPEPIDKNLAKTMQFMRNLKSDRPAFCVVLDGDADRIGGVDADGTFVNSHQIFALVLKHLVENRKWTGEVVKTFNITRMIDKLCAKYKLKLYETPIGFKYACDLMQKRDILLGGEESGGLGVKNHIPERDGILMGLFLLELMATGHKTIGQILNEIMQEVGFHYYDRYDLHLKSSEQGKGIVEKLKEDPLNEIAGVVVDEIKDLDGIKYFLKDGSWVLFRASGTEPLLRIYVEAGTQERVGGLLEFAKNLV